MRIDDNALIDIESVAKHNVFSLTAHPAELKQFFHRARHLAATSIDQRAATSSNTLGLVPIEARGLDFVFKLLDIRVRIIRDSSIFFEQLSRYNVDAFVRALSREDRGDEQL